MVEQDSTVKCKSKKFALRIIKLYNYLCEQKKEYVLSKQLLRSGTSIGANVIEAQCAITQKDFLAKIYIAFKECAETQYWIELLHDSEYLSDDEFSSINDDCVQIRKLLSSITKTTKDKINS